MIDLFLSEPNWNEVDEDVWNSGKTRLSLLNKLESVIWSLMASGARSEARLWLCDTIAGITGLSPHHKRELFINLLMSKKPLATQLLHMIFYNSPRKAGSILAERSYSLRSFFKGNPTRISQWFSKTGSGLGQGQGANALSQFTFVNRDHFWQELEWKGKHGQSPAVVATKPHYFDDLDVQQTVDNFLDNVPEFWSSNEFSESLKDGKILAIDRNFFVQYFLDLMYKDDSRDVWEITSEFLEEECFSSLCKHLLIILEEGDLCDFLKKLHKYLKPRVERKDPMDSYYLFEVVFSKCSYCGCFDQILLLNAVFNYGRQLIRLIRDEGAPEDQAKLDDIVSEICAIPVKDNSMAAIIKGCSKVKTIEAFKLMGLQSWVIFLSLQTAHSWESLFRANSISFRMYDKYSLLHDNELAEEGGSDLDHIASRKVKHTRKNRGRKKRRRNFDYVDNELLDFDATSDTADFKSSAGGWLISVDGYSATWSSADLPEYLYKHCLSTWIGWALALWD